MPCMFLVPRLWPSPTRTVGESLRLSLSSAIILIIIVSRGLIELARAKYKQCACQSKPLVNTAGVVSNSPPPYPTYFAPPGLIHSPSVRAVPRLSSCTDQDGKLPTFLDTALSDGQIYNYDDGIYQRSWQQQVQSQIMSGKSVWLFTVASQWKFKISNTLRWFNKIVWIA